MSVSHTLPRPHPAIRLVHSSWQDQMRGNSMLPVNGIHYDQARILCHHSHPCCGGSIPFLCIHKLCMSRPWFLYQSSYGHFRAIFTTTFLLFPFRDRTRRFVQPLFSAIAVRDIWNKWTDIARLSWSSLGWGSKHSGPVFFSFVFCVFTHIFCWELLGGKNFIHCWEWEGVRRWREIHSKR